jgi:hypothetical protein
MPTGPPPDSVIAEESLDPIIHTWSLESRVLINTMKQASLKTTAVLNDATEIKNDIASMKSEICNMKANITQVKIQTTVAQYSLEEALPILEAVEVQAGQTYGDVGTRINPVERRLKAKINWLLLTSTPIFYTMARNSAIQSTI